MRGDKAYSSRDTRARLRARGVTAVIPEPADQDDEQRNVVERFFNRLKP